LSLMDWTPILMSVIIPIKWGVEYLGKWFVGATRFAAPIRMAATELKLMGGIFVKIGSFVAKIGTKGIKAFGWIGKSFGFLSKFLGVFGELLGPIGWVIMAFQLFSGLFSGYKSAEGGFFSKLFGTIMGGLRGIIPGFDYIVSAVKWIFGWIGKIAIFMFKWLTPVGQIIMGFKFLKKLFSETFSAIGNLFGKVWGFMKKVWAVESDIVKFLFKWLTPVGLVIQAIKMIWPAIGGVFSKAWSKVSGFFHMIGAAFGYVRRLFSGGISGMIHVFDHFLANMVNGITNIGHKIVNALRHPFKTAWSGLKHWMGHSPSELGQSILRGIQSVGGHMRGALTSPFHVGIKDIIAKIMEMKKHAAAVSTSIEKRAQAAYIPAVTVTPTGTQIETPKAKGTAAAKEDKAASQVMSEETGQKIVALLEKILAKDNSLYVDGSLLSTKLARNIDFRGSFGTNR